MKRIVLVGLALVARIAHADPCPSHRSQLELGKAKFPDLKIDKAHCIPVRAAIPLALVTLDVDDPNTRTRSDLHPSLLVSDGNVVATLDPGEHNAAATTRAFSVADLDGDGRDELIVHGFKDGHMGSTGSWLEIHRTTASPTKSRKATCRSVNQRHLYRWHDGVFDEN